MVYAIDGIDFNTEYGIRIERTSGLLDLPKRKGDTAQDWPDSDGEDPFVDPTDIYSDARDIMLHCYVRADSEVDLLDKLNKLRQKLNQEGLHSLGTPHYPEPLQVYCKHGFSFVRLTKLNRNGKVIGKILLKLREPVPLISPEIVAPAITPGNGISETGLVGYFPLNLDTKDYSESLTPGTVEGTTTQKSGNIDVKLGGGALDFTTDALVAIDSTLTNELASNTAGAIEFYYKPDDATPLSDQCIIGFGDTNANECIAVRIKTDGKLEVTVIDAGVTAWILETDTAAFSDAAWAHILIVQDGTSPVIYVDGIAPAQTFTNQTDKTKWFNDCAGLDTGNIGCLDFNTLGNAEWLEGVVDEVKFYNAALTAAQVLDRCNYPKRYSNPVNINTDITTATEITIKSIHPDATIRYTTDGTGPTATNGTTYSAPFTLPSSKVIKAIAILNDEASTIATEVFVI